MPHAELICFEAACRARYPITEVIYNCPKCGGLLEVTYDIEQAGPAELKRVWRERRCDNAAIEQSGVWRYRELIDFLDDERHVVTLREGNTPLLPGPKAAAYGGLDRAGLQAPGLQPTGSFKDNGMTCGASQAMRLGMKRVACVSTGNTSASMAAYASAAGLAAHHLHPARQHIVRQARAGARVRRADIPGRSQLRSDSEAGPGAFRAAGNLPAELDQSVPHRRPEVDRDRNDGPARLESARLDRVAWRKSRQCFGVRQSSSGVACSRLHTAVAAFGGDTGGEIRSVLRVYEGAERRVSCR